MDDIPVFTKCTIRDILLSLKEKYLQEGERAVEEDDDWYIYESDDILSLATHCCITCRPEFDENDEEIFPEFALENNMEYSIMPELVIDVVINALNQKRTATDEELLKALNYYLDTDAFIKL